MKTIEVIAHKRSNLTKGDLRKLRMDAKVPGILYGSSGTPIMFYTYMAVLKDLSYASDSKFVDLNVEGSIYRCVAQDVKFHPVSGMIEHIDMLKIEDGKKICMNIPLITEGRSPGVALGGILSVKVRHLPVKALPENMPESIKVDLSSLNLKDILRVKDLRDPNYEILKVDGFPVVSIDLSRALKSAASKK